MEADLASALGCEMLWDDAGWSVYPEFPPDNYDGVFMSSYEGPDFSQPHGVILGIHFGRREGS